MQDFCENIEIVSCIGRKEDTLKVLEAGADSIYAGLKKRSWRDMGIEFSWDDLVEVGDLVHTYGKKLYVAVNRDLSTEDVNDVTDRAHLFVEGRIDGLIVSDWGCIAELRKISPDIEIHLSANTGCVNPGEFRMAKELGVQRIVFSTSLTFEEVEQLTRHYHDFEWETVVYGGVCFNEVSHCPCKVGSNGKTIIDTCRHSFAFSFPGCRGQKRKPFGLPLLDGSSAERFFRMGINHWKLEGRARGIGHIVSGTRALKQIAEGLGGPVKNEYTFSEPGTAHLYSRY